MDYFRLFNLRFGLELCRFEHHHLKKEQDCFAVGGYNRNAHTISTFIKILQLITAI